MYCCLSHWKYLFVAGLSQRPAGLLLGQVCWSAGHAALGHTGFSMEKPQELYTGGQWEPSLGYLCPLHLPHPLLQPSPVQTLRSSILGGMLQKGKAEAVVIQRFPFPR